MRGYINSIRQTVIAYKAYNRYLQTLFQRKSEEISWIRQILQKIIRKRLMARRLYGDRSDPGHDLAVIWMHEIKQRCKTPSKKNLFLAQYNVDKLTVFDSQLANLDKKKKKSVFNTKIPTKSSSFPTRANRTRSTVPQQSLASSYGIAVSIPITVSLIFSPDKDHTRSVSCSSRNDLNDFKVPYSVAPRYRKKQEM